MVVTLADALQRAKQTEPAFLAAAADAVIAQGDRVQARAGLLPSFSNSTQFLGNSASPGLATGRFVSMDGVQMYRQWLVAHQEISPNTFTGAPLLRARAAEAAAQARLEIAQRGLVVTVTRSTTRLSRLSANTPRRSWARSRAAILRDRAAAGAFRPGRPQRRGEGGDSVEGSSSRLDEATLAMDNARLSLAVLIFPVFNENFSVVDDMQSAPALPPFTDIRMMAERENPDLRAASELLRAAGEDVRVAKSAFYPNVFVEAVYGIEANAFALHSEPAADRALGVLPNLGYAITANLTVSLWDWGSLRSKLHQSQARQRLASTTLSQTQRQLVSNLYSMYNEALTARAAVDSLRRVAELAAESLRLTILRYQAGESTALEVTDAQNTFVQSRNAADDAEARYRLAIAQLQTLTGSF
jgi:outer membrane protein TolC